MKEKARTPSAATASRLFFALASLLLIESISSACAESVAIPRFRAGDAAAQKPEAVTLPEIRLLAETDYAPWSFMGDDGKLQGISADLAMAACTEAGLTCTLVPTPYTALVPTLQKGEGDMIVTGLRLTPNLVSTMQLTRPYFRAMGRFTSDASPVKKAVMADLRQHFRPEFLNRIDETVVFHALDAKNIEAIAKIQLKVLESRLEKMEMKLDVSPAALAEIAKVGFDPVFGARPLKRAIQQRIENPVAKLILEGRFGPKDVIPVDVEGGEFRFGRVVH